MENNTEESDTPEIQAQTTPSGNDWFLQQFVALANHDGLQMSITLQTGGFLVSGILISGHAYFEQLAVEFSESFIEDEAKKHHRESMLFFADHVRPKNPEDVELSPMFIHLKDARLFHVGGHPIPANRPILWRGRISEVSGFLLGQMLPPASE